MKNTTTTTEKKVTKAEMAAQRKAEKAELKLATVNTIDYLMSTFPSTDMLSVENNQANHGRKICFRANYGKTVLVTELWVKGENIDICAKHTMIDLLEVVLKDSGISLPKHEYHESWGMKYSFAGTREEMISLATLIYLFNAYPLHMIPSAPVESASKKGKGKGKGQSKKS